MRRSRWGRPRRRGGVRVGASCDTAVPQSVLTLRTLRVRVRRPSDTMAMRERYLAVEAARLDKYRGEKMSPRPLDTVNLSRVCRKLFSPTEEDVCRMTGELRSTIASKSEAWDFDFDCGVPAGTSAEWVWRRPFRQSTAVEPAAVVGKETREKTTVTVERKAVNPGKGAPRNLINCKYYRRPYRSNRTSVSDSVISSH